MNRTLPHEPTLTTVTFKQFCNELLPMLTRKYPQNVGCNPNPRGGYYQNNLQFTEGWGLARVATIHYGYRCIHTYRHQGDANYHYMEGSIQTDDPVVITSSGFRLTKPSQGVFKDAAPLQFLFIPRVNVPKTVTKLLDLATILNATDGSMLTEPEEALALQLLPLSEKGISAALTGKQLTAHEALRQPIEVRVLEAADMYSTVGFFSGQTPVRVNSYGNAEIDSFAKPLIPFGLGALEPEDPDYRLSYIFSTYIPTPTIWEGIL